MNETLTLGFSHCQMQSLLSPKSVVKNKSINAHAFTTEPDMQYRRVVTPYPWEICSRTPRGVSETADITTPCMCCFFLYIHTYDKLELIN